ncbi:MAG: hypothetical protein HDQ89_04575 [Desulfovibrio sp.]|nr:hypothetical protein [Desulfovibrio sp.]
MDDKKSNYMNPIDPFKFPTMPSLYSKDKGGDVWMWYHYIIIFLKEPVSYYESVYINKGEKCPNVPPIKYLYSMQVYINSGKPPFISAPPILAITLEQYDQSNQSTYVVPFFEEGKCPIILGLFSSERRYTLGEYNGNLDWETVEGLFLDKIREFLKLDSEPVKTSLDNFLQIISFKPDNKENKQDGILDGKKLNIKTNGFKGYLSNILRHVNKYKKYLIISFILLLMIPIYLLFNKKSEFFVADIANNIIYVDIDNDIVKIPYPADFTKIKGKKFIDIEYHQVWGLTGRPNEKNDESAYEILNLIHDNIYCRIGFICNSKDGQIIKNSFSSFNHYKDLMEQFAYIKNIPLYKNEKKVILDKGDNFIAVTTIYSGSGIKEQRIVIETVIAMYIDEYIIETSFLLGTELAHLENQSDEYAKVVKNYIKSFNDIKVMDNAEILIELKESLRSIRD